MVIANLALRFALEVFGLGTRILGLRFRADSRRAPVLWPHGRARPRRGRRGAADPNAMLILWRRPPGSLRASRAQLKERIDMNIAPSLHRLGSSLVNSYLVEDGGSVTIIDAGLPGYWRDLPTELAAMGRSLDDVRGVVLTHGDTDHVGFAERLRRERGIPVYVHRLDADRARGEVKKPSSGWGPMKIGPLLGFLAYSGRRGGLRVPPLTDVVTFDDGATLDLPGAPRVIHHAGAHAGKFRDPRSVCRRRVHGRHDDDEKRPHRRGGTAARTVHAEARRSAGVPGQARRHRSEVGRSRDTGMRGTVASRARSAGSAQRRDRSACRCPIVSWLSGACRGRRTDQCGRDDDDGEYTDHDSRRDVDPTDPSRVTRIRIAPIAVVRTSHHAADPRSTPRTIRTAPPVTPFVTPKPANRAPNERIVIGLASVSPRIDR